MDRKVLASRLASISGDIERLKSAIYILEKIDISLFTDQYEDRSVDAARRAEWIALRLRNLVYAITRVRKREYLPQAADTMGIKIEQQDGMYEIILPGLMPKRKSTKGTAYLVDPLMAALERHVQKHGIVRFPHSTVCFIMVYDRALPEQRIRDYDNLELKVVLDAVAAFLMDSDGGLLCDAYHSTELGETDCTRVFVMDSRIYPQWYEERQTKLHPVEKDA